MQSKSKIAAGILALTLGWAGVHNFYLGNIGKAILQLGLYIVTWFFIVLAYICIPFASVIVPLVLAFVFLFIAMGISCCTVVWEVIEAVQIFTGKISRDAKGVPLK